MTGRSGSATISASMLAGDRELIHRLLAGDAAAVELIAGWSALAARPYRAQLAPDWEDVVQEVQIELLELLRDGRFRGDSSLRSFVWRVTSHTCLDRLRARRRRPTASLDGVADALASDQESPADAAARRSENALLWRALGEVPPACRELLGWVVAGHSYREMSERSGIAEGTLRVRVLRCRQKACDALARLRGAGGDVTREPP